MKKCDRRFTGNNKTLGFTETVQNVHDWFVFEYYMFERYEW